VRTEQTWPDILWLARHGESAGNVARDAAEAAGLPVIDIADRDMDVPLSPLGKRQAIALGEWLADADGGPPTVVLASPYVRARTTAELAIEAAGLNAHDVHLVIDERLREREFGVLDRLTKLGIQQRYPEQAELRARVGKFYHRPPGGESWCDVILRARNVIDTITRDHRGERLLVVSHQVVVLMFRYLLENLTEPDILEIDRSEELANCSVGAYAYDPDAGGTGRMVRRLWNHVAPVVEAGERVTAEPDAPIAAR
jgi:broad specificity phosphatase PhoE